MRSRRPSRTALLTCLARAAERARPVGERLVDDPYAEAFLPLRERLLLALGLRHPSWVDRLALGLAVSVVARHRAIDDALLAAVEAGAEQVVLLGAGYDARAHRFASALAGVRVFEVDHPATSARKARIVAERRWPSAPLTRVPVDFEREDLGERLVAAGFRTGARTCWAWEGVSMYLRRASVEATLERVRALSAPGSVLAMDLLSEVDEPTLTGALHRTAPIALHLVGEPITFAMHPDDAPDWLARAGFGVVDRLPPEELARRYPLGGRRLYPWLYVVIARVA